MGDAEYLLAFVRIVMPIAMEFGPDLVMSKIVLLDILRDLTPRIY